MERRLMQFYIGSYAPQGTAGIFSALLNEDAGTVTIEPLCDEWLLVGQVGKHVVVDLHERLSLDDVLQAWLVGEIVSALFAPEA